MLAPEAGMTQMVRIVGMSFLLIAGSVAIIAAVDVPFQLWRHADDLKMSRQELRQEQKESEGDPQIKAAIRNQQRAMARRRMMAEVPKASVIVTNPTHYAVALSYEDSGMGAPRVVAKGADLVAARIREIGRAAPGAGARSAAARPRAVPSRRDRRRDSGTALYRGRRSARLRVPAAPLPRIRRGNAATVARDRGARRA